MITLDQVKSVSHVVIGYAMGAVTAAMAVHVISSDQGNSLSTAISQIASGITSVVGGVMTIVAIGSAIWAGYRASPTQQMKAVEAMPEVDKIAVNPVNTTMVKAINDTSRPKVVSAKG